MIALQLAGRELHIMELQIESMAIAMPLVTGHPNRESFRGVLTLVDVASDRPPSGSRGHKVVLTRSAAEAALASLLGMGLDYSPELDRHDAQRKVGVITSAEIVGRRIELGGYLFAKDFPAIVRHIGRGPCCASGAETGPEGRGCLGMSYEVTDARVADMKANVWMLTRVTFTGAAILRREKAAYQDTWIQME